MTLEPWKINRTAQNPVAGWNWQCHRALCGGGHGSTSAILWSGSIVPLSQTGYTLTSPPHLQENNLTLRIKWLLLLFLPYLWNSLLSMTHPYEYCNCLELYITDMVTVFVVVENWNFLTIHSFKWLPATERETVFIFYWGRGNHRAYNWPIQIKSNQMYLYSPSYIS